MIVKMQKDMVYAYRVFDEYFGDEYIIIEKYEEYYITHRTSDARGIHL